jgi:hypothetical protein
MRIQPLQRQVYLRGQMDGERGLPPQTSKYRGDERVLYERGYGRGFDARYRAEHERKQHGNTGFPRPRIGGGDDAPVSP